MNLEFFIAKRIHTGGVKGEKRVSSPAIKIAVAGVAIGLAAMLLSVSIVIGFKTEIRNKVVGFGSHIQIANFENNTSYETNPICVDTALIKKLKNTKGIQQVELFATIPGIVKTPTDFQGIVLKGVASDYNWDFFKNNMVAGDIIHFKDTVNPNQVLISQNIANKLHLKVGDSFETYFVGENVRVRKLYITGIYNTNFEDYDKLFIITNLQLVQRLHAWQKDQVSGIELLVNDYDQLDEIKQDVYFDMMTYQDRKGNTFFTRSIKEINPMLFNWLNLLDMNVWIIIILMLAISVFTMISGLLILILERTNMIGMLKTLGATNYSIRKTFLYVASFVILKGIFWGNLIAFVLLLLQKLFGIIQLPPETYYVSEMPVVIHIGYILLINIATLLISIAMMLGPSYLIAKISPAKSIRFE